MKFLGPTSSGSAAGDTWSRNRYGQYVRRRAAPTQPRTAKQAQVRSNLTTAAQGWRLLTAANHAAWESFAAAHPKLDSLGQSIVLSGAAAYAASAIICQQNGQALPSNPPAFPSTLDDNMIVGTWTAGALSVVFTPPAGVNGVLQIWGALPQTTANGFAQGWRFLGKEISSGTTPAVLTTDWVAAFGTPPVGKYSPLRARVLYGSWVGTSWYRQTPVIA